MEAEINGIKEIIREKDDQVREKDQQLNELSERYEYLS